MSSNSRILPIGKIWKSEANGWCYSWGGYLQQFVVGLITEYNRK